MTDQSIDKPKMKRKSVGALTLRTPSKKQQRRPNIGDLVFNVQGLLEEHLLPFLEDEYEYYNYKRINKNCAGVVGRSNVLKNAERNGLSLLSQWFCRKRICCVCKSVCEKNFGIKLGMYCHERCVPPINIYYDLGPSKILITGNMAEPIAGFNCKFLYNTFSPCVNSVAITCRGHNLYNNFKNYLALDNDQVCKQIGDIDEFVKFVRKSEQIDRVVDKQSTVRVGTTNIKIYKYFCELFPNHINTMTIEQIKGKIEQIRRGLENTHEYTKGYYKNVVRPKLFVPRAHEVKTWTAFLKIAIPQLREYNITMQAFFIDNKIHHNEKTLATILENNIPQVNQIVLHNALFESSRHYYNTLCALIPILNQNYMRIDQGWFKTFVNIVINRHMEVFSMCDTKSLFPYYYSICRSMIDKISKDMIMFYNQNKQRGPTYIRTELGKYLVSI